MNTSKITAALGILAIGTFVNCVPSISWNMQIAFFIVFIFEIIAAFVLINNLNGAGRAGAVLFLLAILTQLVIYPLEGATWLANLTQMLESFSLDGLEGIGGGLPLGGDNPLSSLLGADKETSYSFGMLSLLSAPFLFKLALLIIGLICWLNYSPFDRVRNSIVTLLVIASIQFVWMVATGFTYFRIEWPLTYVYDLSMWILGFVSASAYLNMASRLQKSRQSQLKVSSFIVFAFGLMYTYLILVDNSYKALFFVILGSIIFLVGVGNIRDLMTEKKGTGAFIAYGVLMLVTCLMQLIPGGEYVSFPVQIAGFIVLGVGLLRIKHTPLFHPGRPTGMITLGVISFLLIGGVLTFLVPGLGEGLSGFVFCLVFFPMIMASFYNMVKGVAPAARLAEVPAPQPAAAVPAPPLPPVPEVVPVNKPTDHSLYMPHAYRSRPTQALVEEKTVPLREERPIPVAAEKPAVAPVAKTNYVFVSIAVGLVLAAGGVASYFLWYKPYQIDKNAPRYYTFTNANLRSSRLTGSDVNVLNTLLYGTELIVYEKDDEWASVKHRKTEGYVASPYIVPKDDFYLLNSLFGDKESRECIETAKCRQALLLYYKQNKMYGAPHEEMGDYSHHEPHWVVFTKGKNAKPNAVSYPRLFNRSSKFTDFAVIIKNTRSSERRLLIFTFDDETERPSLIYEEQAPPEGDIQHISSATDYYSKGSIRVRYGN